MENNCKKIDATKSQFEQKKEYGMNEVSIVGNKTNIGIVESEVQKFKAGNVIFTNVKPLQFLNKSIAVHVHLYYVDLLPEIFNYLNNIPYVFDLYVSCSQNSDMKFILNFFCKLRLVNDIIVRKTVNRGRDVAPLYVLFRKEIMAHDYFLHIHSKKSLFTGVEQSGWRQQMLKCLLGTVETVQKIFMVLESNLNIGIFFPENLNISFMNQIWTNRENGKKFMEEYKMKFEDNFFSFPVGNFFWAKTDSVEPLFKRAYQYDDFEEEFGQTDATLAHTLERGISWIVWKRKYHSCIYDYEEDILRLDKSERPYRILDHRTSDTVKEYCQQFDVIVFDIFGTLVSKKNNNYKAIAEYVEIIKYLHENNKKIVCVNNSVEEKGNVKQILQECGYIEKNLEFCMNDTEGEVEKNIYQKYIGQKILYVSDNLRSPILFNEGRMFYYSKFGKGENGIEY